jgi:hypothetical protein
MTPPIFNLGNLVEVKESHERFTITQIQHMPEEEREYSDIGQPYYPASSLRLVEELKIGNWVEVIGDPVGIWCDEDKGHVCEIVDIKENRNIRLRGKLFTYPTKSLRKLTPEEIQQHQTAQMLPKPAELQELRRRIHDLEMSLDGFTNGPEPEYVPGISHVKDPIRKRLSAIESRLDKLGPSHSELMGDVGALAEKIGAIEKRQKEQHERMDRFMQDYREHKDFDFDMHDRIKVLEGEMPEACDEPSTYTGSPIRVSISRDGIEHLAYVGNPDVAMRHAKKVLDDMREA